MLQLEGIRIVSLAEQYPGPYATLLLADLGADVILVERPGVGDPARQFPAFHAALNRNKRSVALNLKADSDKDRFRDLVASADVLLEGFRPGTMGRLGLGYEAMASINPGLVYASISGFGQTGPYRNRPAHDLSYQALAGFLHGQVATRSTQLPSDIAVGDLSSGMFAALGILAALLARARTGRGAYIDVSMTDGLVSWMSVMVGPAMNREPLADIAAEPAYGLFECKDGKLLSLSIAHEDWFWKPLCMLIGMDDVADLKRAQRTQREVELVARIGKAIAAAPRPKWAEQLDAAGIPWGPVNAIEEVASDPHFVERGLFRNVTEAGGRHRRYVAQPLIFDGHRPGPTRGVPTLGEHTDEVLSELTRRAQRKT
jgi:crotonobetainyl-CoA:carnitine CoA-transferase CaiB-like acyl-CoA transferase